MYSVTFGTVFQVSDARTRLHNFRLLLLWVLVVVEMYIQLWASFVHKNREWTVR